MIRELVMNTVLCGDALEQLKTLPSDSIDCCVTSPPYYALRDYGNDKQIGLEDSPEEYVNRLVDVFREVKRVMKPTGTFWLNIGDSYWSSGSRGFDFTNTFTEESIIQQGSKGTINLSNLPKLVNNRGGGKYKNKDMIGIPWMLAFALRNDGWYLRQDIIWAKTNCMPESVKDRCVRSHEYIFLLTKEPHYYFDHKAIATESTEISRKRARYGLKTSAPTGTAEAVEVDTMGDRFVPDKANRRDVWRMATSGYKGAHFATFPEELVETCLLAGCPVGGIVLDPFFGSGTTGRVAIRLNRNYIGIDINPEYVKLSEERTTNVQLTMEGLI